MTTNTNEWRRCPFCGSEVDPKRIFSKESFYRVFPNGDGCVSVECRECDTQMSVYTHGAGPWPSYDELVEMLRVKWNTRRRGPRKEED